MCSNNCFSEGVFYRFFVKTFVLFLFVFMIQNARVYAWSTVNGIAISTANHIQTSPVIVTDGSQGGIIAWQDARSGTNDIYAQRVNLNGSTLWTNNGVGVCTVAGAQTSPVAVSDGAGGAVIAWLDNRNGNTDIFAQRVDGNGNVLWNTSGIAICTSLGIQTSLQIISDGTNGAIITWQDHRGSNYDIYAQRVDLNGNVLWTLNGVAVCTATGDQTIPQLATDGSNGAIITWHDSRSGGDYIYAQRVNDVGTTLWTTNGVVINNNAHTTDTPVIVSDGVGGAIIAFSAHIPSNANVYAQRINSSGSTLWTANGATVVSSSNQQTLPIIASDGFNGAIVVFSSHAGGTNNLLAQRLNASNGSTLWTNGGVTLNAAGASGDQIVGDNQGNAYVTWSETRFNGQDIFVQSIDSTGNINCITNGLDVCTAAGNQVTPKIIFNGINGVIMTWADSRFGAASTDIFAQSTYSNCSDLPPLPPVAGFFGTPTTGYGSLTVNFTDTSANTPDSWAWDFGDGGTATTQNPSHLYTIVVAPTCYTVTLIVTNSLGTSTAVYANYICVTEPPPGGNGTGLGFYGIPTSGYGPLTVNFQDTTGGNPTTWSWDFGDGGTDNTNNVAPSHQYATVAAPTTYTVTLIVGNTFGSTTITKNNYIYVTEPVPGGNGTGLGFSANPTTGFAPFTVNFQDTTGGSPTTFLWDFGDGSTDTTQDPSHQYGTVSAPTSYTVTLILGNAYGFNTVSYPNYIFVTEPVPGGNGTGLGFTGSPTSGIGPLTVNFQDTTGGSPTSWAWNFGDGGIDTSNNSTPAHQYAAVAAPTYYTVTLILGNAFGSNTVSYSNYIYVTEPAPGGNGTGLGFTGTPTSGIGPLTVNFQDTTGGSPTSWAWDFGDGGTSTTENPSYQYQTVSAPTTYSVTLALSNAFGSATVTETNYIFVTELAPDAGFYSTPTSGNTPLNVQFTDTTGNNPTSWAWDFGDGNTDNTQSPSHLYATVSQPTTYFVRLIASNAYGVSTSYGASGQINPGSGGISVVPPAPNAGFYGSPTVGVGPFSVNFVDTSSNSPTSWSWDFGDGGTDTTESPAHLYSTVTVPTYYNVQLIASNNYGSSTSLQNNYILAVDSANGVPVTLTHLPSLKLFMGQTFNDAFNLDDFIASGMATNYSIPENFLSLSSLDESTVNQALYTSATVGVNTYQVSNLVSTATSGNEVKYSTYKIYKLPKIGITAGTSWDLNLSAYTYDSSGYAIPASFGSPDALVVSDTTAIQATWVGNTIITITSLAAFSGPVEVDVIASPDSNAPFGTDLDKERILVYNNLISNGTFSTANDTTVWGPMEIPPGRSTMAAQRWISSYTDMAGTQANGVWQFTFADASSGVKSTPIIPNWIPMTSNQWYTLRMRLVSDTPDNSHQSFLYGFNNYIGAGLQTDIVANVLFGIPTVWTWQETPMLVHGNSTAGYPQFLLKAGGAGNVYVDEIQIINAAPTLVDSGRYLTRLEYPYGALTQGSDTTGWGQEVYPGAGSTPGISVANNALQLDFSGAGSGANQEGIKWTANNNVNEPGNAYTVPVPVMDGRQVGVRATLSIVSGTFNSLGIVLVAGFGVQTVGQQDIGIPPSNLFAAADVGVLVAGSYRTVAVAINPYYQFQFGVRSNLPGILSVSDVDFDRDMDDPNYGDSSLYPSP